MKNLNRVPQKQSTLATKKNSMIFFLFVLLITSTNGFLSSNSNSLSTVWNDWMMMSTQADRALTASVSYENLPPVDYKKKVTKRYLRLKAKQQKKVKRQKRMEQKNMKQNNKKSGYTVAWVLFLLLAIGCIIALVAMIVIDLFSVGAIGLVLLGLILVGVGGFITFLILAARAK